MIRGNNLPRQKHVYIMIESAIISIYVCVNLFMKGRIRRREKRIAGRDTIIANKVTSNLSEREDRERPPLRFFQCL